MSQTFNHSSSYPLHAYTLGLPQTPWIRTFTHTHRIYRIQASPLPMSYLFSSSFNFILVPVVLPTRTNPILSTFAFVAFCIDTASREHFSERIINYVPVLFCFVQ